MLSQVIKTELLKDGPLSDELTEQTGQFNEENSAIFALSYSLNRACHEIKYQINVKNNEPTKIYSVSLYLRALDIYSSIVILIQKGMYKDAGILLRTLFEVLIYLKANIVSPNFLDKSHEAYILNQQKMLNSIIFCNDKSYKSTFSQEFIEKAQAKIKDNLKGKSIENVKQIQVEALAKDKNIDLEKAYIEIYRMFSAETHSGFRSIHDYLVSDATNIFVEFKLDHPKEVGSFVLKSSGLLLGYCAELILTDFNLENMNFTNLKEEITSNFIVVKNASF